MKKLLVLVLLIPVISGFSQNWDINLLRDINLNRNKNLDNTFRFITNSASPVSIGTPIILYSVGLIEKDKTMKDKALYIGVSVASSMAVATIMKYSVNRTSPFVTYPDLEKVTSGGSPSFPSGHTSDAFSPATSLSLAYPKWDIIAPSFVWAGACGYSRMDLGVHYPSDVLMGAIVGAGSAYLCYKGNQWLNKKRKHDRVP
jgi:membrane-associated phospholipid phosphatase